MKAMLRQRIMNNMYASIKAVTSYGRALIVYGRTDSKVFLILLCGRKAGALSLCTERSLRLYCSSCVFVNLDLKSDLPRIYYGSNRSAMPLTLILPQTRQDVGVNKRHLGRFARRVCRARTS